MTDEISPTMEEPAEVVVKEEVTENQSEENELLAMLKSASLDDPAKLDGTIRNASRTFEMQSERDQLAHQLAEMEKRMNKPVQQIDEESYGQPVDLDAKLNQILDARDQKKSQAQFAQQKAMMDSYNMITGDKDYQHVKGVWEQKLQDPNFVFQIQMGQKNPMQEYQETLRDFYKGMMKRSAETIETLQKGATPVVHVESGEARASGVLTEEEKSESEELITNLTKEADTGHVLSEEQELAAIQAAFR